MYNIKELVKNSSLNFVAKIIFIGENVCFVINVLVLFISITCDSLKKKKKL
jgi:hypothetical protein